VTRPLILVDGIDGSGKSHLAERIRQEASAAGLHPVLLRVDDFRTATDWAGVDEAEVYYESYYDLVGLEACLRAYQAGAEAIEVPAFDSVSERVAEVRRIRLTETQVLIVEGVFVRRLPSAEGAALIYIETSYAEARRRILARDLAKGRSAADVEGRVDRRYAPSQQRYHERFQPRSHAHVVVDHEILGSPTVIHASIEGHPPAVRAALAFMADGLHDPTI
jgi:uridine kinase